MDDINTLNKHQLCGYDIMLSDAHTSVLSIVDSCVSYKKSHKHHRCFQCGLYGHIARDCNIVCKDCGGKHLQSHCIVKLVKCINDVFNSLTHDFVKDYNRLRAKVNKAFEQSVVQHKDQVSFVQGEDVSIIGKPLLVEKQLVPRIHKVYLDLSHEYSKLSFIERIALRPKYNVDTVHDLCEDVIRQDIEKQYPGFVSYQNTYEVVDSSSYFGTFLVQIYQDKKYPAGELIIGNLQEYNIEQKEEKSIKPLINKLKRFDNLVKPFEQVIRIQKQINNKQHCLSECLDKIKLYSDKVCQLKDKYFIKKKDMIKGLRLKAKSEFNRLYKINQLKKQHLESKIDQFKSRLNMIYAFAPRTRVDIKNVPKSAVPPDVLQTYDALKQQCPDLLIDISTLLKNIGFYEKFRTKAEIRNKIPISYQHTCSHCRQNYTVAFEDFAHIETFKCSNCGKFYSDEWDFDLNKVQILQQVFKQLCNNLA